MESAVEKTAFSLLAGLYDSFEVTGQVSYLWNRKQDGFYYQELSQIAKFAENFTKSINFGLEIGKNTEIETDSEFEERLKAAKSRLVSGFEVIIVPVETQSRLFSLGEAKIAVCESANPLLQGEWGVTELQRHCEKYGLEMWKGPRTLGEHVNSQLRSSCPSLSVSEDNGCLQLQFLEGLSSSEHSDLLTLLHRRRDEEVKELQTRPIYHRTAIARLNSTWQVLIGQVTHMDLEVGRLRSKIEELERVRGEDMVLIRELVRDTELRAAMQQIEQLQLQLDQAQTSTRAVMLSLTSRLQSIEARNRAIPGPKVTMQVLNYCEMWVGVEIYSLENVCGVTVEALYAGGKHHICRENVDLEGGMRQELRIHRHFCGQESVLVVRKEGEVVAWVKVEAAEMSENLCHLLENAVQVFGEERFSEQTLAYFRERETSSWDQIMSDLYPYT